LNFGFHNAHHARPIVPWYRLPELHREIVGDSPDLVIPFAAQLKIFHKFRIARVVYGEARDDTSQEMNQNETSFLEAARKAEVPGGNAASFLTAF
jgi:fatty acid desaturase